MSRRTSTLTLGRPAGRGPPTPKQTEASTVPRDHCCWFDQDQSIGPTRIAATKCDPEEPVETIESGARLFSFEDGELLAQGHRLQSQPMTWQKECPRVRHHWNKPIHRSDNNAPRRDQNTQAKCFSLLADQVLMTHRGVLTTHRTVQQLREHFRGTPHDSSFEIATPSSVAVSLGRSKPWASGRCYRLLVRRGSRSWFVNGRLMMKSERKSGGPTQTVSCTRSTPYRSGFL
jgi:hypothetical protein